MKVRTSVLDNTTLVFEVEHGDVGPIVDRLDIQPNGFAIMGEAVLIPVAVVDGRQMDKEWFTHDHLLAIKAHELGHIRMDSDDEPTAELEGIRLLEEAGFDAAAQLLYERGVV